jgi:ribosome-associated protein YbcJ (S4-like RNA binding protein)
VQLELFIPQNSYELGLLVRKPNICKEYKQIDEKQLYFALLGNNDSKFGELKGEGQSFLSTLIAIANDQNLAQSESFCLSNLGEKGDAKKNSEINKFESGLQKRETNLSEKFSVLSSFKELCSDVSSLNANNQKQDQSIEKAPIIPERFYGLDFEKLEASIEKEGTKLGEKINLADFLKVLGVGSSKLEGEVQINNQVSDQSIEKAPIIPEKFYGLDFEKLEASIEKEGTNLGEKINLADFLKVLGVGSSKLEGEVQINNQVSDQSIEKGPIIPEKFYGLDFEKLEVSIEKEGTKLGEKINLADLLKLLGADFTKVDENEQISGKKSIPTEGKAQIAEKIILNSNTQEEEITKNLAKNKAIEDPTPKLKLDPQNIRALTAESGSLDRDFMNSLSDKTGSDKGQDALLLSSNQSSGKVSGGIGQTEHIEPFQKQFQTEVLTQIVKKAVLNLKNGHTEIKIELKPEFLGHVRMHIATENQQLMVRMLAEIPLVKDIIESNIHQLKADLQNHGLEVDKFEVFVARDSDHYAGGQENTEFQRTRAQSEDNEEVDEMPVEGEETKQLVEIANEGALIGVFA